MHPNVTNNARCTRKVQRVLIVRFGCIRFALLPIVEHIPIEALVPDGVREPGLGYRDVEFEKLAVRLRHELLVVGRVGQPERAKSSLSAVVAAQDHAQRDVDELVRPRDPLQMMDMVVHHKIKSGCPS